MHIPWARPSIGQAERDAVLDCFDRDWLTMGPKVAELESRAAALTESPHCVAVNSGTAALDMALKLADVARDDEVIIPALSYIATGAAVLYQSATPVFVDIDASSYTLDPQLTEAAITGKTRAIIAIDYAGHAADWDALQRLADDHEVALIEDGAPGLGGSLHGKPLCAQTDFGITSFHMAKTLSAVEGGMLFLASEDHDRIARMMRSQGEDPASKYSHPVLGHNYRMSDLHAAIGCVQMARSPEIYARRREIADYYQRGLGRHPAITLPRVAADCEHAWFLFPVLVDDRDRVREDLANRGIETNVSWPLPIYDQGAFAAFPHDPCPVAEAFTRRVLCLPMYFDMSEAEMAFVCESLIQATS